MEQKALHSTEAGVSRQRKIEECLLLNMNSLEYDRISITEMCQQMGISRRLFYRYFTDKESCLHSLIDRMIRDSMIELLNDADADRSLESVTVSYLYYWKKQSVFLDAITKQNMKGILIDRCFLLFKERRYLFMDFLSTAEVKADDSILWLYTAIRFIILLQWHANGFDISPEEMAVKYLRMLKEPIMNDLKIPF